ncbi:unnamed protein product [Phytophthora fragariaefolia]|uniref:Unnamed protein product n=1 Tax=Phytophthora fragariaefolia TaxID=1490495 RepID=A0A9W6YPG3_9STRA|nr:unnamed protein product [Phytophthora fragariaefolia]
MLLSSPCKVVERSCYSKLTTCVDRSTLLFDVRSQEKIAKSHTATFAHIQQLDLWVYDNVQNLDAGQMDVVVKAVGRAYALAASSVQVPVDDDKTPPSPPVTPLELVSSELSRGCPDDQFTARTVHPQV